ncbi:MAG: gamma carbonic anhydrase family protein [Bacteroidota bacterium]
MLISYKGITPNIHPTVFIAEGAKIIGDVVMEKDASVWFNTVIRGDVNYIRIGERTNIQDNCILHVRKDKYPLIIGANITVGHGAILHACVIKEHCLIGMGATVLDDAQVGSFCLIAAGAVVKEHQKIPEGMLVAGVPAKIIRPLTVEEKQMIIQSAENYVQYVRSYRESF